MSRTSTPSPRLRAANRRLATALALVALVFFAGSIAARQLGPEAGLVATGGAVIVYLLFAIGRHLRRGAGER